MRSLRITGLVTAFMVLLMTIGSALLLPAGARVPWAHGPVIVDVMLLVVQLVWGVAGLLLVLRLPRNPIGWALLGIAFAVALETWTIHAILYTHVLSGQPILITEILSVVAESLIVLGLGAFVVLFLVYPNGSLPGRRWRWVLVPFFGIVAAYMVLVLLGRIPLYALPSVRNPLGLFDVGPQLYEIVDVLFSVAVVACVLVGVAGLAVRWRGSEGASRKQIKWFLWAAAIWSAAVVVAVAEWLLLGTEAIGSLAYLASAFIPVAVVIAVSRYGLYAIDHIVSRTVSYGAVAAMLAALFALIAIGLPQVLGLTSSEPILIAGATLAVAALFNPLRRRLQTRIDRRFNRARYDAEREVDRFAERLRAGLGVEDLADEMVDVVDKTMQPAAAAFWVRKEV